MGWHLAGLDMPMLPEGQAADCGELTTSGVLLCQLELHHDHLGDKAGKLFEEINQKSEDREFNIQVSHAKYGMLQFVERFERTLICIDCNLAEGSAKATLDSAVDWDFTSHRKKSPGLFAPPTTVSIQSILRPHARRGSG